MTTDPITREDLEMAAKAAGLEVEWREPAGLVVTDTSNDNYGYFWTPEDDDGDCARMEAAVRIDLEWGWGCVDVYAAGVPAGRAWFIDHANDKSRARRYASVKLAAAVGRAM